MKQVKRVMAVFLSLIMAAVLFCLPASAAGKKNYDKYKVYTVIGDSVATGYGKLSNNEDYSYRRLKGAYSDLIAKQLGNMKLNTKAVNGERTVEVRYLLDETYKGDAYLGKYSSSVQTLDDKDRASYIKAIKEADVISIGLCSNDIFTIPTDVLKDRMSDFTDTWDKAKDNEITELLLQNKVFEAMERLFYYAGAAGVLSLAVPEFMKNMLVGLEQFKINYNVITDKIYELNPDATVMVMSMCSPMGKMPLYKGGKELGSVINGGTELINNYLKSGCKNAYKYTYVDEMDIDSPYQDFDSLIDYALADKGDNYPDVNHPNASGHKYIADQFMAVLPETQFIDIADTKNYDAIVRLYNAGIMIGDGAVNFNPNTEVTGKQLAYALYRLAGNKKGSYTDVKKWCTKNNILALDKVENTKLTETQVAAAVKAFAKKTGNKTYDTSKGTSTVTRDTLAGVLVQYLK